MAESGQYRSNLTRIMIIATLGGLLFGYDTGGNVTLHPVSAFNF